MHHCGACRIPATRRNYWLAKIQKNADRDQRHRRILARLGWRVLTIWECQTKPRDADRLTTKLSRFLAN